MLTLNDINNLYPETCDGEIYRNLFRDANGFPPIGSDARFEDEDDFRQRLIELTTEVAEGEEPEVDDDNYLEFPEDVMALVGQQEFDDY